ncbi:3-hydroxyacyl-CoA dehydrogenase NAD-binding domain-containing protein (plasmid) [Natrinema zhouii]|uniref:3-hydroxyacyl-CoA dehydrogenase/enoyl-CoA hydratase family protein n=1 Tax=Natrinema zhouii TaxID=1710539 RepID=UPI001CFF5947|nr:3-hydroxyacyl-CoA dehydrogenase NAD-binding domain-containing protein [Natrinema zhouii]UHQ98781.1 3-hydroxyacyl-CoA dehydrogenase NAD-binding domain-containing protein [Natrinema zhouii]
MTNDTVERVAVLGAGSMGHGIAELAAIGGYDVTIRDIDEEIVTEGYENIEWSLEKLEEKGRIDESADEVLGRIGTTTDLADAVSDADLVIEAVPEQLEIKEDTFSSVDEYAPDHAILASNTSSLSISDIASATDRPDQVVGLHFFNPPVKMDLVEVTYGEATSDETAEAAYEWVESVDKTPIYVRKDVHGFVVNTVLVPFMEEAAWMLSNDETTIREADAAMVYERGYPMGPFELNDFGGIDIGYHFRSESDQPVPPVVEEKVENDHLGKKSGKGFYDYDDGDGVDYKPEDAGSYDTLRTEAVMINKAAWLVGNDVATPEEIDIGLRLGGSFPEGMCRRGDRIGLDIVLEKLEALSAEYDAERYEPTDYLVELVEEGWTGEDAGKGFYDYRVEPPYHYINWELDDGVLEVELDRQERMNSMSDDMFMEIDRLLNDVDVDEVSCVVFEGAGDRAFSSGADITGFTADDPAKIMDVDEMFQTVYDFPRPTVAKIDGFCLGAGIELALACDIRIATEDSTIGTPETNLGVIPGGGATQRLVRLIGEGRTKEMVFRGMQFDAAQAEEWGIVNHAVDDEAFEDRVSELVDDLVSGPPVALKAAKRVINDGQDASLKAALAMEKQSFAVLATTDDMLEGVTAFRRNREPQFEGE